LQANRRKNGRTGPEPEKTGKPAGPGRPVVQLFYFFIFIKQIKSTFFI
jgi:hypothetical protein